MMNYKVNLVFTFFFLFLTNLAFAQKENNNWYFGENVGITFNNGNPVAHPSNAMHAYEGTISVSDSVGNLLFYSNGEAIWNRNHVPMQNGTGLLGNYSATQAVLAVPKPGSNTLYYIFTVDAIEDSLINGLRYSILDMSLDGGMGGITDTKNLLLETPVTEKLTAVRHGNNLSYWVLAHRWNSDAFVAYKLTSNGISKTSVISKVGSTHGGKKWNAAGQMKINKGGSKIALAITMASKFELFDFNSMTGVVSNVKTTNTPINFPYGVEFSGDGTKLYCTLDKYSSTLYSLLQFNLAEPTGLNEINLIYQGPSPHYALQLGPDNKIYSNTYTEYLAVINNPNSLGSACNYIRNGVKLNGRDTGIGLPSLIITGARFQDAYFPNIITPNEDNLNDNFVLKNVDSSEFELQIFNRWGTLVYEAKSYHNDWNARNNSAGLYYYLLRNSETGTTYKGWVEVIK
jgi:gliding motility-associated-like protein